MLKCCMVVNNKQTVLKKLLRKIIKEIQQNIKNYLKNKMINMIISKAFKLICKIGKMKFWI